MSITAEVAYKKAVADWIVCSKSRPTLSRALRAPGYRELSGRRKRHAQDPEAIEAFKQGALPPSWKVGASLPRGTPIAAWLRDEARIGQKNRITRRWAKRGTRPSAPHDQRTASACIFGAICPQEGKAAGLVLPFCNTGAMNLHLTEISLTVAPGPCRAAHGPGWVASDAEA